MDDSLLQYYERELTFMRETGAEFAEKYPKIASRLLLEPDRCEDPHTERLLEAFAFLSGRIHKKIDDSFPELTESMLQIIYPHYTCPMPAMTILQFNPMLDNVPPSGYLIDKGSKVNSPSVKGTKLIFKTTQPVNLLPLDIFNAEVTFPRNPGVEAESGVKIALRTASKLTLDQIEWPQSLRFSLNGHQQHVFKMYELILNNIVQVEINTFSDEKGFLQQQDTHTLSPDHILPAGFSKEESILPWPEQSFDGYRLLYEYFGFAEKFLYFDVKGLECLGQMRGNIFEINLYVDQKNIEQMPINKDTFGLYTTPAVNLFEQIAIPVRVEHKKAEYPIYHDINTKNNTEVFSIDKVVGISSSGEIDRTYSPFYSLDHHREEEDQIYWHIRRLQSTRKGDDGMDVLLSFTDAGMAAVEPECTTLTVYTTCSNRDLPSRLAPGGRTNEFLLEYECPVDSIISMMKPTQVRRPDPGSRLQWRLISHLSLNYLSLVENNGRGLKEMLKLYDIHGSLVTKQQIEGIESLEYRHVTKRIDRSFCRGIEVTLTLNEDKFVGSSAFLFASVIEHFLAQYVSINSFSRLVVKSLQRTKDIKAWPARNGNRVLL